MMDREIFKKLTKLIKALANENICDIMLINRCLEGTDFIVGKI